MPTSKPITVSDHAIVRYLERALGMNMEQLRLEIVSEGVAAAVRRLGDGKYPVGRGVRIVVRNGNVVTVEFEGLGKGRRGAHEAQERGSNAGELDHGGGGAVPGDGGGAGGDGDLRGSRARAQDNVRAKQEGDR